MKTQKLIPVFLLSFFLCACATANVSSEGGSSVSSSEGTSLPSSTTSQSSLDLQEKIVLNKTNSVTYNDATGTFLGANGMAYSISNCDSTTTGWINLKQGGCVTNSAAYGYSFASITVEYLRQSDFGYLTAKASSYAITSPENGAYELTGSVKFTFPNVSTNSYFSLYAPVGSFLLTSITLEGVKRSSEATPITGLDFYTINDTHGAAVETASSRQTGITRLSQFALSEERKNPDSTVFVSSGDMWQGSADSNMTHGEIMVNWMNVAGYESMAIGNHEFDWKPAQIEANSKIANFPFLSINLQDTNGQRPSWAKASKIIYRGGYKIGIIGAIGKIESAIAVSSLSGYTFNADYETMVSAEALRLKGDEGCSIVVVSIHNGSFNTLLCQNVDAVFEGHSHQNYSYVDDYGIPHIQTYANGSDVQRVHFNFSGGKFVYEKTVDNSFTELSALDEEPMALGVMGYYEGKIAPIKNEVVGHTASDLSKADIGQYAVQCMFEYYANSTWDSALALAMVNTGCARQVIPTGDITYGQVYAALPFDNDNVFCECTGAQVNLFKADNYLYTYGSTATIDESKTYHVMVISYVSEQSGYASKLKEVSRDDFRLRDIVAADFRKALNA
jgi:2',3'-cyclic-nucleotide 2'-phosphodiesterase (5'-nucleotidase family)